MSEEGKIPLRNIRLLLAYDGTDFSGWQRQAGARTVQGTVEEALLRLHKKPVPLTGSGRTDSGVHAAGQTANFFSHISSMEAARFVPALNGFLPPDVRVLQAQEAAIDFHSRFDARLRTYRYFFITGNHAMPWEQRYAWHIRRKPDIRLLSRYSQLLKGEMDCSSFAVPSDSSISRSRYISNACFFIEGNRLVFEISANAFLWRMVRSIVGTLMHSEEKGLSLEGLKDIIDGRNYALSGPTAPPEGLFLWKINYYRD